MHELAITRSIVTGVRERIGDAVVRRVVVEVGALAGVSVHAIRFCFDACVRGTPLQGAELSVQEVSGRGRCATCGAEFALTELFDCCACGGADVQVIAGHELRIRWVEVA